MIGSSQMTVQPTVSMPLGEGTTPTTVAQALTGIVPFGVMLQQHVQSLAGTGGEVPAFLETALLGEEGALASQSGETLPLSGGVEWLGTLLLPYDTVEERVIVDEESAQGKDDVAEFVDAMAVRIAAPVISSDLTTEQTGDETLPSSAVPTGTPAQTPAGIPLKQETTPEMLAVSLLVNRTPALVLGEADTLQTRATRLLESVMGSFSLDPATTASDVATPWRTVQPREGGTMMPFMGGTAMTVGQSPTVQSLLGTLHASTPLIHFMRSSETLESTPLPRVPITEERMVDRGEGMLWSADLSRAIDTVGKTTDSVRVSVPQLIPQLEQWIASQLPASSLQSQTVLKLMPEHLGQVEVKLTMQQGVLQATFMTESFVAKEALESNLNVLRTNLQHHGVVVERLSVTQQPPDPTTTSFYSDGRQQSSSQHSHSQPRTFVSKMTDEDPEGEWMRVMAHTQEPRLLDPFGRSREGTFSMRA
jgi:hypothetical protein